MRNSPSSPLDLRPIIIGGVVFLGLIVAMLAGRAVAMESYRLLLIVFCSAVALLFPLLMRERVWLLIPATFLLTGRIGVLPLPFSVQELGVLAAFGSFVVFSLMKKVARPAPLGWSDGLLIVNLAYLVTVFARNPAGFAFIQSDLVGARPYLAVLIASLGFWVLQRVTTSAKTCFWLPAVFSAGGVLSSIVGILTYYFPALVPIIFPFYSGVTINRYMDQSSLTFRQETGDERQTHWITYARAVFPCLVSYTSPFRLALFLTPLRSLLFYSAVIGALFSGFRSGILLLIIYFLGVSFFREGVASAARCLALVLVGVIAVVVAQTAGLSVPLQFQRALSFIPADWNSASVEDAKGSSEWRFRMWRTALESDKYIQNKLLGDGFGFDRRALEAFSAKGSVGGEGLAGGDVEEYFMIIGSYHSGPVSAIRYVGLVGLVLFTALMISVAVLAWKLIYRCKGTPFFPLALFLGVPVIYKPFEYWLVFGSFENDLPYMIMALAFINLTSRSLEAWKELSKSEPPGVSQPQPQIQ